MPYQHDRDLNLAYEPDKGYWHFVLYMEPGIPGGSAINASQIVESSSSPYAHEWLQRLERCEPEALHVALVGSDAKKLWQPCVYDDPESPSAVAKDGCVCWQTYRDPRTLLPVASHHYRTVTGNIEYWRHFTCAPLSLPSGSRASALIIDRDSDMFWVRTDDGRLYILPEKQGEGYGAGYSGGGPRNLSLMVEKIVESDGHDVCAGLPSRQPKLHIRDFFSSEISDRTREMTLPELKNLYRGHVLR